MPGLHPSTIQGTLQEAYDAVQRKDFRRASWLVAQGIAEFEVFRAELAQLAAKHDRLVDLVREELQLANFWQAMEELRKRKE